MEKICMTEEVLERESRAFDTLKGTTIFITQRDGCFYAYQNVCPHLQTELEYLENQFLDQDREYIQCSTHGALFSVARCLVIAHMSRTWHSGFAPGSNVRFSGH